MIPGLETFIQKQTVSSASELFPFYCKYCTRCNPDFLLSYLGSGALWSINMWEPDSATSSAEFLSYGVGQILLLSLVEFLSRVWRSGV